LKTQKHWIWSILLAILGQRKVWNQMHEFCTSRFLIRVIESLVLLQCVKSWKYVWISLETSFITKRKSSPNFNRFKATWVSDNHEMFHCYRFLARIHSWPQTLAQSEPLEHYLQLIPLELWAIVGTLGK